MNALKSFLRAALQAFGLQLLRLPDERWQKSPLKFGPYLIETDSIDLKRAYHEHPFTHSVIPRLIRALAAGNPNVTMIDVGANCGDTAALAKTALDLPILCVEPDPHLFSLLKRNMTAFKNVTLVQRYIGEQPGQASFVVEKSGWNNSLVRQDDKDAESITFTTLDELVADCHHGNDLSFLKCDTEGFDVRVLHGAQQLLSEQQPVVLFEYNRDAMDNSHENGLRVFELLGNLGYHHLAFYDAFGRFILDTALHEKAIVSNLHDYLGGVNRSVVYFDIIAFHARHEELMRGFLKSEKKLRLEQFSH